MDRLRRGQPEARAELFRQYAPQVRRILYLQGFCEEVDDAVQEVFIKVYRAKEIPREEAFLAWFAGPGGQAVLGTFGFLPVP